jgi:hypothetical protein
LAQARRDARERVAIMTSLEAELAALREATAETEHEAAGLRDMVMRTQRDAEQSAAAIKSTEADLAAAPSALAAARQVGRAATNALVSEKPAPLDHPRLGWRQAVKRLLGLRRAHERSVR